MLALIILFLMPAPALAQNPDPTPDAVQAAADEAARLAAEAQVAQQRASSAQAEAQAALSRAQSAQAEA
ncbi:MAG TPA: cell envelope biogenesis protein TolA, partial [Anaerolineae bacterium]